MILALAFALTWQSAGLTGVNANALLFDDGKLYAATDSGIFVRVGDWSALTPGSFNAIAADPTHALYAGGNGIFKSVDGGLTWSAVNRGLPSPIDVSSILVDNHSNIYLGSRDNGIFKSTDGGMSWRAKPTGVTGFVITLAIDPRDSAIVYAGTNRGVLKSVDGGNNWRQI